ncbi:transmembrane protein 14C-like protein [Basidiobolus meristosporus CBS 931.73]|uniref:Transmembrane protein 14C-like protein n=1 Tax=Basidiobolus meristosporus CBS 931.73 TaxID=1314790 RepID=A0A1Y1Y140_9FUNG|nr:transmembrane protein 14C-like protein [Basidiobolus meristosporus CBS 931.73]|eukprot:ORX91720.1 transmembrane protein 14C-like protein [Basidiobolus meristosporus CBS 931.73]
MTDYLGYGFGAAVAAGGILGYAKAGSKPSLAAGLSFGGLIAYGASRVSENPKDAHVAFGVSAVLLWIMGKKYYRGRKLMPAGIIALLSLVMTTRYGYFLKN